VYIHIDLTQLPPSVEVCEPDEFNSFSVVASVPPHVWIEPGTVAHIAGRTSDAAWRERLAGMIDYAASKGWVNEHGQVRAHIEVQHPEHSS
jgi:hypothetical protein